MNSKIINVDLKKNFKLNFMSVCFSVLAVLSLAGCATTSREIAQDSAVPKYQEASQTPQVFLRKHSNKINQI